MSRTLTNILLILLIAFIGSVMPIDIKLFNFNFDFSSIIENAISEPEPVAEEIILDINTQKIESEYLYNPNDIIIPFLSNQELSDEFKSEFLKSISFKLTMNLNQENIPTSTFAQHIELVTVSDDNHSNYALIINKSILDNLTPNHYNLQINSPYFSISESNESESNQQIKNSINIQFTKTAPCKYLSTQISKQDETWATLYFANSDYSYLIPISRQVQIKKNTIRTWLNALKDGPKDNRDLIPTVPRIPSAWLSDGALHLKMISSLNDEFVKTDKSAKFMFDSIIKTMCTLDTVKSISFKVDKKQPQSYHSMNLTLDYSNAKESYAYKGWMSKNNRLYIIPELINNANVSAIINALKSSNNELFAPLPPNVAVIDSRIDDKTLHIKFSNSITTSYPNQPLYQQFMMDSLVQSLYSLPDVDKLLIEIEGSNITTFANTPIGTEFTPSTFINPEE